MSYEELTPESPEAHSGSPVDANVAALAELFPSVMQDGQVDFDALRTLLGDAVEPDENERFGLHWHGKKRARWLAMQPSLGTLRPCREESLNWDTTKNLYIEGDNLEVLKLLRRSYSGRVKMIYIDPPYNTGNDFVYKDDYCDNIGNYKKITGQEEKYRVNQESGGRYHTNWLNFIFPRLLVARDLLSEDGAIFISIDDNEVDDLKKICNEIFGERNIQGQITVVSNPRGRDYGGIARMHDYILVYGKSEETEINLIEDKDNEFKMFDSLGGFELRELRNRNVKFSKETSPSLYYPFFIDPDTVDSNGLHPISLDPVDGWIELWPLESQGVNVVWRWGKKKSLDNLNVNIMARPKRDGSYMIVEKYRESRMRARSVWWDKDTNTEKGTLLVKNLLGGKYFDYPKPVEMLRRTVEMGSNREDIVIDFFSGSATTAHAVMQLNAEDGGNRRFIMVQLPERCDETSEAHKAGYKNICEIGKERIRRAGRKIKEEAGLTGQDLDVGFRVYKLDSSNVRAWNPEVEGEDLLDKINRQGEHLEAGRTGEDFLTEIMLKCGIDILEEIEEREIAGHRVQSLGYGQYYACMDENLASDAEQVALGVAEWHREEVEAAGSGASDTSCVVFVLDQAFKKQDAAKMNFVEILKQYGIGSVKAF